MTAAPQKLKLLDAALYALAVGTGMRWIAVAAADGPSSLPFWVLALVVFYIPLCGATLELSARFKGEGGIYGWTRDTLGPLAGFMCGWFYWLGLMPYFANILYFVSGLVLAALGLDPKDTFSYLAISLALSALVTGVQIAGLKYGKWLPNIGTTGGWVVFGVIVLMALVIAGRGESATDFAHSSYAPRADRDSAILWATIVFAFAGAEAMGFLRNEVEGGMRTLVRALVIAGLGTTIVYVLGTASFLAILPQGDLTRLQGFPDALRLGLAHVGMGSAAPVVIGLFALTMIGSFTAWFGIGARVLFSAGIDSYLPPIFARKNASTGAPVAALLLQAVLMMAMVVLSQAGTDTAGAYDFLVSMSVLGTTIPYLFMFWVYFRCARMDDTEGGWRPPGGKPTSIWLALLGLAAAIVATICTIVPPSSEPHPRDAVIKVVSAAAAAAIMGLVLYVVATLRRRST